LYDYELERIMTRLEMAKLAKERDVLARKLEIFKMNSQASRPAVEELDNELKDEISRLEEAGLAILKANEPTVLAEGDFSKLQRLTSETIRHCSGEIPLLLPEEAVRLSVRKGTLTVDERRQIESHVTHTYAFLKEIPWTGELREVPAIAFAHHEKLNGEGYPRGLQGKDIPIQARMMTVADIFDALSAADRPYKKALPVERALAILESEAKNGLLDPALVKLFIEARIYERTLSMRNVGWT
ncbi:MAG: HD domain-containing phosphohydrolase, partial [Acidobacteriota bacterium]